MNFKAISRYIGYILQIEGIMMLPALIIALMKNETNASYSFVVTFFLAEIIGLILFFITPKSHDFYAKEGFVTVSLAWILLSIFGALPFMISGVIPNFVDAVFETVSGFTTTGSSILTSVENLPYSILYWRCFTNWVGGMGVLVFMLAIVPLSNGEGNTFHLMKAESPGPSVGKLTPTIQSTSRILYGIYIGLTLLLIILLLLGGMPLFDSVCASISTAGTGGFSIKNASIGYYSSPYIQFIIGLFMFLFGINFNIYYFILIKQFRAAYKNQELRMYIFLSSVSVLAVWLNILKQYSNPLKALLDSFFQIGTVMSTTGFATTDFNMWPTFSKTILVILMLFGACAGSTAGGFKISRVLILLKALRNEIKKMLNPHRIRTIQIDGRPLENSIIQGTYIYLVVYAAILLISVIIVSLDGFSFETTLTSVIATLNNIGPGLDMVGPTGNFSSFSFLSKIILTLDMLIGRLEIFPMIILFSYSTWKNN